MASSPQPSRDTTSPFTQSDLDQYEVRVEWLGFRIRYVPKANASDPSLPQTLVRSDLIKRALPANLTTLKPDDYSSLQEKVRRLTTLDAQAENQTSPFARLIRKVIDWFSIHVGRTYDPDAAIKDTKDWLRLESWRSRFQKTYNAAVGRTLLLTFNRDKASFTLEVRTTQLMGSQGQNVPALCIDMLSGATLYVQLVEDQPVFQLKKARNSFHLQTIPFSQLSEQQKQLADEILDRIEQHQYETQEPLLSNKRLELWHEQFNAIYVQVQLPITTQGQPRATAVSLPDPNDSDQKENIPAIRIEATTPSGHDATLYVANTSSAVVFYTILSIQDPFQLQEVPFLNLSTLQQQAVQAVLEAYTPKSSDPPSV